MFNISGVSSMEPKKSVGKYALIFEPTYDYCQYAIYFREDNDVEISKIQKYSDKLYGEKKSGTIKKNTLGDIDKITTGLLDLETFFASYVDPKVFKYTGYNLHKMFIGYKFNEWMYTLQYILDNPSLLKSLDFLKGSKIYDVGEKQAMMNLITNSKNNSFLRFVKRQKQERKTNLSDKTFDIASRFRASCDSMEGGTDKIEISNLLQERLTSYKDFREMFLLKQAYLDSVLNQKDELQQLKNEAVATSVPKTFMERKPYEDGVQLSFFDIDRPKVMSKKDDFYN